MHEPLGAASTCPPERMAEFAVRARRYRLQMRIGIGGCLVCLVSGMVFAPAWPMAFPIGWSLTLGFVLFAAVRQAFLPACPSCRGDIGRLPGRFCRECGLKLVADAENGEQIICPSGAHAFHTREGKTRRGKIRYCAHCALRLDEKGL